MQNQNYRARTGGYRSSGTPPRRPNPPPQGAQRPRQGAPQGRTPGSAARPGYSANPNRRPQPQSGQVRRPAPAQPANRRPAPPPGNVHRPPQHTAGVPRRPAPQGASRRPAPYRAPRRRPRISLFAFVALACVVAIAAFVINLFSIIGVGEPTFIENVYVNGMSFEGMTREQGYAAAQQNKEVWLNEVYTFGYLDRSWTFTRSMVGADVSYEMPIEQAWNLGHIGSAFERKRDILRIAEDPIHIKVTPTYDDSLVDQFIDQICAAIDVAPVDAVVVPDVNQPVVLTQSQTGLQVNRQQLKEQIVALITTDQVDTALPVETVFPAINSDDLSYQVIAQFSTDVSFRNGNSRTNVRVALNAFNGLSLQPGQSYSFNDIVGERTEANGFKEATEYAGDMQTLGIGGGVCQASTTLYNALVMSGMTITDRSQHTMTVSYVDPSLDAAVSWPKKDLQFKNETPYPIYIYTSVTKETATVTIYGHKPEYFYRLESVIVDENIPSTKVNYIEDTEGKFVQFTDETYLESEGKPGCIAEGWIVAYDWDTKQEVSRKQISRDNYSPGASVYYYGMIDRLTGTMSPTVQPTEQFINQQ